MIKSTHEGRLTIGEIEIPCAVLSDGTRIISYSGVFKAFGRTKRGTQTDNRRVHNMPAFLNANNLQPFVGEDLRTVLKKVDYEDLSGKENEGFNAHILPLLCKVYLDARAADTLKTQQLPLARASEILLLGLSTIGIIALVDEVTGYQDVRVKDELEKIFNLMLLEKAKKYTVTYPLELYKQMFRLNGWEWRPENAQKRPGVIGKWTNDLIYDRMAPGLLKELQRRNPKNEKGYRDHKHFQFLTEEVGEPKLREYFGGLLALARASTSWRKFYEMVERAFPKQPDIGDQLELDI